jgi:WXG100 family type VII secretion target
MAEMTTDAAALSAAASEFDRIAAELKGSIVQVEATAGELARALQGPAGTATQAAFARFREAANKQIQELNDISENITKAGVKN